MESSLVAKTADALYARGVRPTIRRVRQELGSGSFADIAPALKNWWAREKAPADSSGAASSNLEALLASHAAECERLKDDATTREALAYTRLEGLRRQLYLETDAARERSRTMEAELVAARKSIKELEAFNLTLLRQLRDTQRKQPKG